MRQAPTFPFRIGTRRERHPVCSRLKGTSTRRRVTVPDRKAECRCPRVSAGRAIRGLEPTATLQVVNDRLSGLLRRCARRVDVDLGILRRLVGRTERQRLQLTAPRLLVQAFHVPLFGHRQRRVHVHFVEFARPEALAPCAARLERRDE